MPPDPERQQDRSDDGYMRSNMIACQLRLTEGVILGLRFPGPLRMVNGTSLVVAVATLEGTRGYFGAPSGAFAAHHHHPLCVWEGGARGALVGGVRGRGAGSGTGSGGGGSRRSPRNEAWFSPFPSAPGRPVQQRIITMTNRNTKFPNADGRQLLTGLRVWTLTYTVSSVLYRAMHEKEEREK